MIYPEIFPESRENEFAEKNVFNKLKALPTDDFDVFYNLSFSGKHPGEKHNYQIDFIVADIRNRRLNGIICIEVKGGKLELRANGNWFQNNKIIKSPVDQINGAMHSMVNRYGSLAKKVPFDWALCFPDVAARDMKLPELIREDQLIDLYKLNEPQHTFLSFFDALKSRLPGFNGADIHLYHREFKAPKIRIYQFVMPLNVKIREDEKQFVKLTEEQGKALEMLSANPLILVKGIAGSGKTLVAKEAAQSFYEQGMGVLFLCFNRVLANNINSYFDWVFKKQTHTNLLRSIWETNASRAGEGLSEFFDEESPLEGDENLHDPDRTFIQVDTFHSFAYSIIKKHDSSWWNKNIHNHEFWDYEVPIKIDEIMKSGEEEQKFDVIIIDEGQDFMELWYEVIDHFLASDGKNYIFMDDLQNINQALPVVSNVDKYVKLNWTENCRNTKRITAKLSNILSFDVKSKADMPTGREVSEESFKNSSELRQRVIQEIKRLVHEENVRPEQILILLNSRMENSSLTGVSKIGNSTLREMPVTGVMSNNCIHHTHIKSFKGLEADVVFIIDVQKVTSNSSMLYAQASRAKHLLYLFEHEE